MNDLIDRQAAIDVIDFECGEWRGLAETIVKEIEHLPSAQPERQWIPCSERLPNCNGIYIVTRIMSDGFECQNIVDACYFDGTDTWHDDTRVNHGRKYLTDVAAWMPLPEPYKEEQDEFH